MSKTIGKIGLSDHLLRIVHTPRHAVLSAKGAQVAHAGSLRPENSVLGKGRRIGRARHLTLAVDRASVTDVEQATKIEGTEVGHGESLCGCKRSENAGSQRRDCEWATLFHCGLLVGKTAGRQSSEDFGSPRRICQWRSLKGDWASLTWPVILDHLK